MMDGRIRKIRETLENNNYKNTLIMSYTAKYSSSFYGPFRHAVGSSNNFGNKDKSTYQMDYGNSKEAIREAELDISEERYDHGQTWVALLRYHKQIKSKLISQFLHIKSLENIQ